MSHLSVVAPVYREAALLEELCSRLKQALDPITEDYEIVLVEDGGGDNSWEIIREQSKQDNRIKGVKFSRNFGQHYAISAGLEACNGDWVIVMDGDLQDRPEVIPELYAKAQDGYDVVFVARQERPENILYKFLQRCFYAVFKTLARMDYNPAHGNFSIISRKVVDYYNEIGETLRFYGGIINWLGFRITTIDARHGERFSGETKYTFASRLQLATHVILAHSDRPLRISIFLGLAIAVFSFLFGVWVIYRALAHGVSVEGWASVMVSIYFIGGIILFVLGIMGLYIGKVFEQAKGRPLFVIEERVGFSNCTFDNTDRQRRS